LDRLEGKALPFNKLYQAAFGVLGDVFLGVATRGKKVVQSLVIPIEKYDDDDEIRIPVGMESSLIDAAVEKILNLPPEDMVNDNNEKTR